MRRRARVEPARAPRAPGPAQARTAHAAGATARHPLLALQRAAGNRAAGATLRRADPAEREAERAADAVARGSPHAGVAIRPAASPGALPLSSVPGAAAARQGGSPLPDDVRRSMEARFGHDFGGVRVHTGARASASARAVNALAWTAGRDVVFRAGAWSPGTPAGQRLLAHELAHVVQQDRAGAQPVVQRYEGPEHQDLGDRYLETLLAFLETDEGKAWAESIGEDRDRLVAQIRGDPHRGGHINLGPGRLGLTPGQIISLMGDFYGKVKDLAGAPQDEIGRILMVLEKQRAHRIGSTAADAAYERITGGRYLKLAAQNATHFARRNRAEWRRLHEEALALARAAGTDAEAFERALLTDAAAGHFLTDAFASGHLIDYDRVMAAITAHLRASPIVTANREMQTYVGVVAFSGKLPQLVLKNVHDRLNREGFEVTNARGMRWKTRGDDSLAAAPETQRVAALAVFLSRRQLYAARWGPKQPDPAEIESLMPDDDSVERATVQAIAGIPEAARGVESLIYRARGLAPTQFGSVLGAIVESNLSTIGDPARERQMLQLIEQAERLKTGPAIAPTFTLGRF